MEKMFLAFKVIEMEILANLAERKNKMEEMVKEHKGSEIELFLKNEEFQKLLIDIKGTEEALKTVSASLAVFGLTVIKGLDIDSTASYLAEKSKEVGASEIMEAIESGNELYQELKNYVNEHFVKEAIDEDVAMKGSFKWIIDVLFSVAVKDMEEGDNPLETLLKDSSDTPKYDA